MREIKFRAWHNEAEEYCDGTTSNMFMWIEDGQDMTIEQYTGLKDKNGVEIYDGDILKANGARDVHGATVKWFESGWNLGYFHRLTESNIQYYKMVIVGNIHENPELVGGQ